MHDDPPQQLERTEPPARDAAWNAAFLTQLTHDLALSVAAYARKRASWLEGKAGRAAGDLWRDLYQDAITDTWTGDVSWDPERAPLDLHLKRVIRSRTSMAMKHLECFPRIAAHTSAHELEREMSDAMTADRASERAVDLRSHIDAVIDALYELATGDDAVLQILECFDRNILDRCGILHETKMTATAYHNARRRLRKLVERLPPDTREEAIRAMA